MPAPAARHVLYVEDDRINIILMEEAFRRLPGWTLQCVEDGAQALRALQADLHDLPDLVMIDMHLPDMSGTALLQKLHADERLKQLPCVALSADDQGHVAQAALAAGFSEFWVKPVDVQRIARFAPT